jgi:CheY-like chemotaxis protein
MKDMRRILIIEDNVDDEELLRRELRKAQLDEHIQVIRDGGQAMEYLTDEHSDSARLAAIFLDLRLPKVHGLQILKAVRAQERLREVPIIVLTSSNAPEELAECERLGVTCFVTKPMTFASFARAFTDALHP